MIAMTIRNNLTRRKPHSITKSNEVDDDNGANNQNSTTTITITTGGWGGRYKSLPSCQSAGTAKSD